jgi:hypothetical protein
MAFPDLGVVPKNDLIGANYPQEKLPPLEGEGALALS